MEELQIQCTNNNTLLNFLKQENQRLTGLVYNLQNLRHTTTTFRESSQQLSSGTQGHCSSLTTNKLENSIYIKNNSFVTNLKHNSLNSTNNHINNHQPYHQLNLNKTASNDHFYIEINNNNNNLVTLNRIDSTNNNSISNKEGTSAVAQPFTTLAPPPLQENDDGLIERREVFIPGFMEINSDINLNCIALSVLKAILPSLNHSDISGVRLV